MHASIYRFVLALGLFSGLVSCTRNEAPLRRSNSRSSVDHLIIKEVFYIGHVTVKSFPAEWNLAPAKSWYEDDQYITIYNPTSSVKYLDGLALCTTALDPSDERTFAGKEDFRRMYIGVEAISYFPGSGQEHPIQPGQTVVIAKYAIDHAKEYFVRLNKQADEYGEPHEDPKLYKGVDSLLNLTKADWEWTNIEYDALHMNNPNVPDLVPILTGVNKEGQKYADFGIKQISGQNGIALIQLPWTPEDFKTNYQDTKERLGYRHYINVTNSQFADFYAIEIPFSKALDCITVCPTRRYKINPYKNTFDKGYNAVTEVSAKNLPKSDWQKYSGLGLIRKWDGKKFVDDNNSTSDFEVKPASLGLKKATPTDK